MWPDFPGYVPGSKFTHLMSCSLEMLFSVAAIYLWPFSVTAAGERHGSQVEKGQKTRSRALTFPWTPKQRGDGAAEAGCASFGVMEVP